MPHPALKVADAHLRSGGRRRVISAQYSEVANAIDFVVITHAPITIAKTDLWPNIKIDFHSAFLEPAMEGAALRPGIDGKGPLDCAPTGLLRCAIGGPCRGRVQAMENRGRRERQKKRAGNRRG